MQVFSSKKFQFPYRHLRFPGQHTEEIILFVCREAKIMVFLRWLAVFASALLFLFIRAGIRTLFVEYAPTHASTYDTASLLLILTFTIIALIWVYTLWRKSVFIITTRRLTKFIHTTPWNRYQLSLGLDKIVDTGAYQKGFIQAIFRLGYLVARSSAGNIKNFKILNITYAEDLHNYVNKLLFTFNKEKEKLDSYRPFIPHLKGEKRESYLAKHAPEYSKSKPKTH